MRSRRCSKPTAAWTLPAGSSKSVPVTDGITSSWRPSSSTVRCLSARCGALSGGATLLGLYAGKGTPEQEDDPRLHFMIEDLVKWFKTEYGEPFGGIRCEEIIAGDSQNTTRRCPLMVAGVFQKVKELLVENGYDLSGLVE